MRYGLLVLILFVFYCLEAGLFLVVAPWNAGWERVANQLPLAALRALVLTPIFRGAVSGFGLVHLVWGIHDLRLVLARRRPAPGRRDAR